MPKKSITLLELIIAMTLLGIIMLGAFSFHIAGENFFRSSEKKVAVLNDATYVLKHVAHEALKGLGDLNSGAAMSSNTTMYSEAILLINQEADVPSDPSDGADKTVGYGFDRRAGHEGEIFFDPDYTGGGDAGGDRIILTKIARLTGEGGGLLFNVAENTARIIVVLRYDPTLGISPRDNPEVTVTTTVEVPGWSLN